MLTTNAYVDRRVRRPTIDSVAFCQTTFNVGTPCLLISILGNESWYKTIGRNDAASTRQFVSRFALRFKRPPAIKYFIMNFLHILFIYLYNSIVNV